MYEFTRLQRNRAAVGSFPARQCLNRAEMPVAEEDQCDDYDEHDPDQSVTTAAIIIAAAITPITAAAEQQEENDDKKKEAHDLNQ